MSTQGHTKREWRESSLQCSHKRSREWRRKSHILVQVARIASVMHPVMAGSVEDILQNADLFDALSVDLARGRGTRDKEFTEGRRVHIGPQ